MRASASTQTAYARAFDAIANHTIAPAVSATRTGRPRRSSVSKTANHGARRKRRCNEAHTGLPSTIAVPSRHEEVCQLRLPGAGAADDAGAAAAAAASTAR